MKRESIRAVIARNLKIFRKKADLSQQKLSVRADLHHATVGFIEREDKNTTVETLEKIANYLGIDESQLLDRSTTDQDIPED